MESHGYVKRRKNTGYVFRRVTLKNAQTTPKMHLLYTKMHALCEQKSSNNAILNGMECRSVKIFPIVLK